MFSLDLVTSLVVKNIHYIEKYHLLLIIFSLLPNGFKCEEYIYYNYYLSMILDFRGVSR